MQIDRAKFLKEFVGGAIAESTLVELLHTCEIKPVDCDTCDGEACMDCTELKSLSNNYNAKLNELDKIFIGAPVMLTHANGEYLPYEYQGASDLKNYTYRLPTVEEAPRNVWLTPWLEKPKKLKEYTILIRYCIEDVEHVDKEHSVSFCWDEVEAVMIMEDFKYEYR